MAAASRTSAPPWKRYLKIAIPALLIVVLFVIVFWPAIQTKLWIAALHANEKETVDDAILGLTDSDRSGIDDTLYDVLTDPDASFLVRRRVGRILLKRNRLTRVEAALAEDDLGARLAALTVLSKEQWFRETYLSDSAFRVEETVRGWLGREEDPTRTIAVDIVRDHRLEWARPQVRALIRRSTTEEPSLEETTVVLNAMQTAIALKDCEAVPLLRDMALDDPADGVRRQALNVLYRAVRGPQPPCPDAVDAEQMRDLALAGLEGGRLTQLVAMGQLAQEAEWAEQVTDRLIGLARDGADGVIRRTALRGVAGTVSEDLAAELPRFFHDPEYYVRSEAITTSTLYARDDEAEARFEGCWIGLVRDETEKRDVWDRALRALRDEAGTWIGLPPEINAAALADDERFAGILTQLFTRGEGEGFSRDAWADAWFRWFAEDLGLAPLEVDAAAEARTQFWEAAKTGDATAMRAALDRAPIASASLFSYEQGWLMAAQ
ncbi:MAG: hypothetical protein ACYTG6_11910 [Planctomycetota bacterium]